ncbi:MAG TPA: tRNA (N6-isopentenyl adenosine(37)-C2)-methylthiotransferase MiaB [Succinivibrionaceae bacterium]|nr:tRNA (N6-isopentenyl adenosine(37)-C2)-methylthiotransferase MiaB [Succinivibrionaceae bacterium]
MTTTKLSNIEHSLKIQSGTFYIAVWGCQMNVYDADRLRDLLTSSGYTETSSPDGATVVALVTCAVRAKAEDKVFNQIASWKHNGQITDSTIVALGGCVGTELGQKIVEMCPDVSIVFGPRTAHRLPAMINAYQETQLPVVDVEGNALEKFDDLPESGKRGPSAFVTIMEGCSNKCTYCIVPYTRGAEESRPLQDILDECMEHIANGSREIHLLGQNVNSYRGLDENGSTVNFSTLLYEIAALPGIERLRFTTSNPMEFNDDVIKAIGDLSIISDSIHIPVQSGSDRILELMHRRYTHDSYLELVRKIRAVRPSARISSDFIVGFPGEAKEDFEETMRLVEEVKFDQSFSFIYSKRPGTPASDMPDSVTMEEKQQRLYRLQNRLEELAAAYSQGYLGTTQRVLVEGISRKDETELKSRASCNRIVVFKGDKSLIGQMVDVKITGVMSHTLKGDLQ